MQPGRGVSPGHGGRDKGAGARQRAGRGARGAGAARMVHDFDWAGAEKEFKLALELSPGAADIYDHYGWLCGALERYDEALELVRRAQELDPLTHRADVATTLLRAGRLRRGAAGGARAASSSIPSTRRGRSTLGWAYLKNGMAEEGIAELERAVALHPGHHALSGPARRGVRADGPGGGGAGSAAPATGDVAGTVRVALPSGLRLHRAGRAGYGDRASWSEAYEKRAGSVYGIKGSFLFTIAARSTRGFRRCWRR